jgi:HEPN superfamily AbiU2-like protein
MTEEIPREKQLGLEVLDLLWSYSLLQSWSMADTDCLVQMKSVTLIRLLSDDIILRLCKLRDDDTRSISLSQVVKHLRKRADSADRAAAVERRLAEYRRLTENLERHRDTYIAHRSKRDKEYLRPPVEMLDAIRLAVALVDELSGMPERYEICGVDLRRDVLG